MRTGWFGCSLAIIFLVAGPSSGCLAGKQTAGGHARSWANVIGESFLDRHPGYVTSDSASPNRRWNYEQGLMLLALLRMWQYTGEGKYFEFVERNLDQYITAEGTIGTYKKDEYNLDNIAPGRAVLAVYDSTHAENYRMAAALLRRQLAEQPRTSEGGFWHKGVYPYQMWLDGLFMAEPFYAEYARRFNETDAFDDIANQFIRVYVHTRDENTGLLYHAWDERKDQRWANPVTGCSPQFWGRAMGWYLMGLVDVLDVFPAGHSQRDTLVHIVQQLSASLMKFRDENSGLWYQVVDQASRDGNYLETSASAMFAYVFAKGVRKGYLPARYLNAARETFQGLVDHALLPGDDGHIDVVGTCRSAGLGGDPYRDGSYAYYVGEPQRTNDLKGIGSLLLAAIELEQSNSSSSDEHKTNGEVK